jgi:charged multivesicular body protein 3
MKIAGSMKASTEVMKSMSNLMKIPELQKTMTEMSKEMMKAGIIDEMINDTMDSVLDEEGDLDNIADAEVEKIILEITQGKLKDLPAINKDQPMKSGGASAAVDDFDDEEPEEEMTKRLEALRS